MTVSNAYVPADLITTDPFLFQHLKLPLQLRLPLHLLLRPPHKHGLAIEVSAVHVLYCLWMKTQLSEELS